MQLLVSVTSAAEASAALEGGADLIDAKDPVAGALGAVSLEQFRRISAAIAGTRLVTAALGDAVDEWSIAMTARAFTAAGAAFVKVGFAGITSADRVAALLAAAVGGVDDERRAGVVAVAYADADRAGSIDADRLVETAAFAGARGVLLDTFDKKGGGLRQLIGPRALGTWVAAAHQAGLIVALAGKLAATDLSFAQDAGADIAGVRGAACAGGRTGQVTADRVRALRAAMLAPIAHASGS